MKTENSTMEGVAKFIALVDEPWDQHATVLTDLFLQLSMQPNGITTLARSVADNNSANAIHAVSGLLTNVEQYPQEINALYLWISQLPKPISDKERGNLATAVQKHIILLEPVVPPPSQIHEVMVQFLLECLDTNDWTIWLSAITSLDGLDRLCALGKWMKRSELTMLKDVLRRQIKRATEEWDCGDIGRLQRFLD